MQNLRRFFSSHPHLLFRLDCLGAALSAFTILVVLPAFPQYIGMPIHILNSLGAIALVLVCYSGFFAFQKTAKPIKWMRLLAASNAVYACLTLILVVVYNKVLMAPDYLYFSAESAIIIGLAYLEWKVAESIS